MNEASRSEKKIQIAEKVLPGLMRSMKNCHLCFRKCGVDRLKGEKGFCASGAQPMIYSYGPHHGEEPPLSGRNGSGTIFFSRCNMGCVYCQNYRFSQHDAGKEVSGRDLGNIMLELERAGCHNINLVSPTHFVPIIVEALKCACSGGLKIPVVYNTGGYDALNVVRSLEGLVEIYLPDMRYSSSIMAAKYSAAPGYVPNNRAIVKEMYRQAGKIECFRGVARKGLIVRLLILPGGISGTLETLEFIQKALGKEVYLSVMSQYYPAYKANSFEELSHRIKSEDYYPVIRKMDELGFSEGWVQPFDGEFDKRFAGENFPPNL
ncbi:MAG: radical SAM protein [Candidatus Omnitrophota bacterium]